MFIVGTTHEEVRVLLPFPHIDKGTRSCIDIQYIFLFCIYKIFIPRCPDTLPHKKKHCTRNLYTIRLVCTAHFLFRKNHYNMINRNHMTQVLCLFTQSLDTVPHSQCPITCDHAGDVAMVRVKTVGAPLQ